MSIKYILFDLDGTLTDPKTGITRSVAYALDKLGIKGVDPDTLTDFIGPPLIDSFMKYYGFSEENAREAVDIYREYFKPTGMFENEIYPGIEHMLSALRQAGAVMGVATSKPEIFAETILEHFDLAKYFDAITGSLLDGRRTDKGEVVKCALERMGVDKNTDMAAMVGDRSFDMIGAVKAQVLPVGVEYGYGTAQELWDSGAKYICDSVEALEKCLLSLIIE